MADKSTSLMLDALSRAATDPAGLPLYGSKNAPGLFAASANARQAAEACKQNEYLRVVRTEARGKTTHEVCSITEKGLAYLLTQLSPRQVLEDMIRALDARRNEIAFLTTAVGQMVASIDAFKTIAEKAMQAAAPKPDIAATHSQWLENTKSSSAPGPEIGTAIVAVLDQWHANSAGEDCPLPELRRRLQPAATPTVGQFHDALRSLYEQSKIYLHPWTGPLYEIPDPALALMVGHEIAYYASLRR